MVLNTHFYSYQTSLRVKEVGLSVCLRSTYFVEIEKFLFKVV